MTFSLGTLPLPLPLHLHLPLPLQRVTKDVIGSVLPVRPGPERRISEMVVKVLAETGDFGRANISGRGVSAARSPGWNGPLASSVPRKWWNSWNAGRTGRRASHWWPPGLRFGSDGDLRAGAALGRRRLTPLHCLVQALFFAAAFCAANSRLRRASRAARCKPSANSCSLA